MTKVVTQNRFKSPVLWTSLAAQILTLLLALGVINTGLGDTVNIIVASVLQILVALGILNSPTNPDGL